MERTGPRKCDAYAERTHIANSLSAKEASSAPPPFDLGTVQDGWTIRFGTDNRLAQAFRATRLSEVAGLPAVTPESFPSRATGADLLRSAAERIVKFNPELAMRLVLRSCTNDEDESLKRVLSRNNLAQLPDDTVQRLVRDCKSVMNYSLSRGWVERLRVAIEVMSRLVSRQESDSSLETIDYALEMYRDRDHQVMSHAWIGPPLGNLFERTWNSLSQKDRTYKALDLLGAPIVGLDDFMVQIPQRYPDPGMLVNRDSELQLPERCGGNEAEWQSVVTLLLRALRTRGEARERAAIRLGPVAHHGVLTGAETSEMADALWASEYVAAGHLPTETTLFDWAFLALPDPKPGLADRRFRRKWLSREVVQSRHDLSSTKSS